ncbi:SDR family NAD(P)-dependent oxidoreductase [Bradyrhizobium septentrionale]|uniref:type I polyketide synthase n=1 Tax=Bradyrhizobium septentrionale TaxID=1404411 RepID=UPI001596EA5D|nr:type I polyketide synthase [Bradyrhizobium septentrionale]UGY28906.1 SDR family NAD(P)-dependent oxidoreductase [Bradyrhizobium septentrionale]
MTVESTSPVGAIAVIGLACRLPGANSAEEFWSNLRAGVESITFFTPEQLEAAGVDRKATETPGYVAAKGVLEHADCFDAGFFGISPREAELMDPQQRVFLECAWTALEDAGCDPREYSGAIGVFAGTILSTYLLLNVWPDRKLVGTAGVFQTALGNDPTFLATRASYLFDLRGPSVSVGTACSTSLMAVHLACQSLLAHESDMALAGGVSIHLPLIGGYLYEQGGILSPDGHCRPFDAAARGTVSSDGVGVVALKRLEDAIADGDIIRAVIRGSAANNDGNAKVGYTAPSGAAQARVISEAMAMAGVEPETVSMIEAHAAGTLLGDPIEVAALTEAFAGCDSGRKFCAIGSVKSNIGHVDAAAGIAGLIKTVLALQHRQIPPSLHFRQVNPKADFSAGPFYVSSELRSPAPGAVPMRAGVSSFGIGGSNVHVVLEEPPVREPASIPEQPARPFELLVLSAASPSALETLTDRLAQHLETRPEFDLADVGHSLRRSRRAFEHRRFLVCRDRAEAIANLRARDPQHLTTGSARAGRPPVTFMFSGLGDHYPGMGWELYCTEPPFRRMVDRCSELLRQHMDGDIRDYLYPGRDWSNPVLTTAAEAQAANASNLDLRAMLARGRNADGCDPAPDLPATAQPMLFVTEIALAELLRDWGIEPDAMIGHSIGEFAAACLSGVLSLPDALELVAVRARLIQTRVKRGAMLAVPLDEAQTRALLPDGVSLGAVNGFALTVASGHEAGVAELERRLVARGISAQRLRSTHAYHSQMLEDIVEPLLAMLARVKLNPPKIPYISCLTGTWITDEQAMTPRYWAEHLCRTVRFHQGLCELLSDSSRVLLEIGPGQSLTSHAITERARTASRTNPAIPTMRWSYGRQAELAVLMRGIGLLWLAGVPVDAAGFVAGRGPRLVSLPTYPFERQRYWIDPPANGQSTIAAAAATKKPKIEDWFYLPCWKPSIPAPMVPGDKPGRNWLLFLDRCGVGLDLAGQLRRSGESVVTVTAGTAFRRDGEAYVIDPRRAEDYRALLRELHQAAQAPGRIVHLWELTGREQAGAPSRPRFDAAQETGYHSLIRLVQGLCAERLENETRIDVVANRLCDVGGDEPLQPEKATMAGPALVAPQEHPGLICRCLDMDIPPDDRDRRDQLVTQLMAEVCGERTEPTVAYRRGRRWVQGYEAVRMEAAAGQRSPFRDRGVYLLTGGLGGIGLVVASHLAQTVQARLVLIGRSAFPERAQWDGWLAEHDIGDRTSMKIRQLMALEQLGSEVLILCADVSSREDMHRAIAAVDARFGELHGVIHGAGAVGVEAFREINQASVADADAQFAAKVHGVMVLDEVLADRPLDFCVMMSSLSAVLGGLGFAVYSAGNLFLDAFARWKNRTSATSWVSIDWESWRLTDVQPVIAGLGATVNEFAMQPREGAAACERILTYRAAGQVIVSSGDLHARLHQWVGGRPSPERHLATAHRRPDLRAPYMAPRGHLETALAEIWRDLFNVDPIGVNDDFFELGGHSLLATQLNARLSSELQVEMSLATLLQVHTIAELALTIVSAQARKADPDMLERMLAEVGELSEAHIQALLTEESGAQMTVGHE